MKYIGNKARISKEITTIFNKIIKDNNVINYIEPFVGGANVIENIICENKYGFDNNEYLIALWIALLSGYNPPDFIDKETYHNVKENPLDFPKEFVGLTGVCASYNGNWFSSYGAFGIRTSNGKREEYYQQAVRSAKKQLAKIKDVKLAVRNYQDLKTENMINCFIYCDPPYAQNKKVYKDKDFDHEKFWQWCKKLSVNNYVIISEYTAPKDFEIIWEKQLSKMFPKQKKDTPTEKLFVYKNGKLKIK